MDTAELEALAESTALGLSRANQRLLDLEANLTTHVGLDWGNQGLNYPHPNQSVSTVEFGGAVGRLDENGIQIKQGIAPQIYFVESFSSNPNAVSSKADIRGFNEAATGHSYLYQEAVRTPGQLLAAYVSEDVLDTTLTSSVTIAATSTQAGIPLASIYVMTSQMQAEIQVGDLNGLKPAPLVLKGANSDPGAWSQGAVWRRSDLDKVRYANGVNTFDNFAMEAWVNAAITAVKRYDTIQDEGIALTQRSTINFVGAGVTASDLAGITTVTVPGGALDSANEFWLARSQQGGRGGVLA